MAQDSNIYEAVCKVNGHDLFVLPRQMDAPERALCKRCGHLESLGDARCTHGAREERGVGYRLDNGDSVRLNTCSVCQQQKWELISKDALSELLGALPISAGARVAGSIG